MNKLTQPKAPRESGFTLIEVIVLIVLIGAIAAVLAPFIGRALTKSHEPLENLRKSAEFSGEMAKVVAEYRRDRPVKQNDLAAFQSIIDDLIDSEVASVLDNELVMFRRENGDFVEFECENPDDPRDCLLKVRLQSEDNPGETLTYYFSYHR